MMRNKVLLWVVVLSIALMGIGACAMPIHFEQGSLAADAVVIESAEQLLSGEEQAGEPIDIQDFQLLSWTDNGMLIFADGRYMTVDGESMLQVIEQVGEQRIFALPQVDGLETIGRGSDKEAVAALQQALIDAGYLNGAADGSFGGKSAGAVSAFQKDMGLNQTGEADPLTQLLLVSAMEAPVNIVTDFDPAMRYEPLVGKTTANLSAISQYGLELDLDDISGEGSLNNGSVIALDASGETDLDAYFFTLDFALFVTMDDVSQATITPGIHLSCECVRRPIMEEIILKSGDLRATLPVRDLRNALSGPKAVETGTVKLDEGALKVLANAAETGELKFRIKCKYNSFDGAADPSIVYNIANIGNAGLAM